MRSIIYLTLLVATPATAQIYKCADESGNVTYSMSPCLSNETSVRVMGPSSDITMYYRCADKSGKPIYRTSSCLNNETKSAVRTISRRGRKNSTQEAPFWQGACHVTEVYPGTTRYTAWCEHQFHYRDEASGGWNKIRASYFAKDRVVKESSICEMYVAESYEKKICSEVIHDVFIEKCDREVVSEAKKMYCDIASRFKPTT